MTPQNVTMTPRPAALINKALAALAIAVYAVAAITLFPSFGPSTAAKVAPIVSKADGLNVATAAPACAEQNWPNFGKSCLYSTESNIAVKQVRTVSTDKL